MASVKNMQKNGQFAVNPRERALIVHETSIPVGQRTWQISKYWDQQTLRLFLQSRQDWFWSITKPAPYSKGKGEARPFKQLAWVLQERSVPARTSEGLKKESLEPVGPAPLLWAEAQGFFRRFVSFHLFIGSLPNPSALAHEAVCDAVQSLITGLFHAARCDHLSVYLLDDKLINGVAGTLRQAAAKEKSAVFFPEGMIFCSNATPSNPSDMPPGMTLPSELAVFEFSIGQWMNSPLAGKARSEQKYLAKRVEQLVQQEQAELDACRHAKKRRRRGIVGLLMGIMRPKV